jgi:hypothetical protein
MRPVIAVTDMGIVWRHIDFGSTGQKVGTLKARSQKALAVMLIGLAAFAASRIYYLQEMLAALILFAVLFSGVAVLLLLIFIVDRAGEAILEFLELRTREALQHARDWRTYLEPKPKI